MRVGPHHIILISLTIMKINFSVNALGEVLLPRYNIAQCIQALVLFCRKREIENL